MKTAVEFLVSEFNLSSYKTFHRTDGYVIDAQEYIKKALEMEEKQKMRDLYNDKVEITASTLIEINRAFDALKQYENSYIHKVFADDNVFNAIDEIKKVYNNYFN
jgi:hypothetical protein